MIDGGHGDTGSGKSLALERLAGHIWETAGLKTRVYYGDGGEDTYNDRGLVDDGVIELMDFSTRPFPETVVKLIGDGWFLKDPKDPNSKLIAPAANFYETHGLVVYEGGSVMGNYLLSDVPGGLGWHAANNTKFGGVKDEDDELSYKDDFKGAEGKFEDYLLQGSIAPKHYQLSQRKIVNTIRASKKFPRMTFWTFHSTEGADKTSNGASGKFGEITGKKIIGPDVGGRALASTIGREFGNLFHFDQAITSEKTLDEVTHKQITLTKRDFRVYTRRHHDPNQEVLTEYIAGTRTKALKDYYSSKEPGDTLLQVYQAIKEARTLAKSSRVQS